MGNGLILLIEKSKEELIAIILEKQKRIEELEKRLREKEEKEARRRELKMMRLASRVKRARKPGQKAGHIGLTRSRPDRIDRVVEQTIEACPDCRHPLSPTQEILEHIQEDIVPARVEVTLFRRHRYYCSPCKKIVTAPYAPDEVPHSFIGPNALIQMAILKYHHALPGNKIVELFRDLAGLRISEGAVAQAFQRLAHWLKVEVSQILQALRESPQIHIDETGWKINGRGHWLWAFVNERLAYYRIERSRGSKVPRKILPKDYGGILITDFYSAYSRLPGRKQKCLVHLFREMSRCFEKDQSVEFIKYHKELKRILQDALRLRERRVLFPRLVFEARVRLIKERLFSWSVREYPNKNLKRLAKRFLRYWTHLVTFLENPAVSFNNNLAERMILPNVILRNRSYQNRSPQGARAHEGLMSLIQTLRLQGSPTLDFLKQAYLNHRQGRLAPILNLTSEG